MPVAKRPNQPNQPTSSAPLAPYWTTTDGETVRLYHGNVLDVLARLPERSVHCVVTSPPYWSLRDYGEGQEVQWPDGWFGAYGSEPTPQMFVDHTVLIFRKVRRVLRDDGTLWLNLGDTYSGGKTGRDDNDSATRANLDRHGHGDGVKLQQAGNDGIQRRSVRPQGSTSQRQRRSNVNHQAGNVYAGLSSGNLVGVPWRVALALQADGWVLRQDVIWHKPAPMPESVRNRCTKAHEYVFLLTKGPRYFYDAEAIKDRTNSEVTEEEYAALIQQERDRGEDWYQRADGRKDTNATGLKSGKKQGGVSPPGGRNKRSVWTVSSQGYEGYEGAHFATFPPKLIEPMILAGTSAKGACAKCGAPWRRVTERTPFAGPSDGRSSGVGGQPDQDQGKARLRKSGVSARDESDLSAVGKGPNRNGKGASTLDGQPSARAETVRWEPTCTCHGRFEKRTSMIRYYGSWTSGEEREHGNVAWKDGDLEPKEREAMVNVYISDLPLDRHPVVPCTVLDPFIGSGTTCAVAVQHGRRGWGIDLSEKYLRENAVVRIKGVLVGRPALAHLVPRGAVRPVTRGVSVLGPRRAGQGGGG